MNTEGTTEQEAAVRWKASCRALGVRDHWRVVEQFSGLVPGEGLCERARYGVPISVEDGSNAGDPAVVTSAEACVGLVARHRCQVARADTAPSRKGMLIHCSVVVTPATQLVSVHDVAQGTGLLRVGRTQAIPPCGQLLARTLNAVGHCGSTSHLGAARPSGEQALCWSSLLS